MKQALILSFFLIPFLSFSQLNGSFTVDWQSKKEMTYGDLKTTIPYFSGNSFRYDTTKKSITLLLNVSESGNSTNSSVQISNVNYEAISINDLGDLTTENIPEKPNETLKIASSRDKKQIFLSLSPIIKDEMVSKEFVLFLFLKQYYIKKQQHFFHTKIKCHSQLCISLRRLVSLLRRKIRCI
ncbi:hypothetical protein [Flavobacterium sp. N2038]|uniref:type IX secretion system sortase PorU, long form n=1 Tax=Flavobacterium sp. N2038 TaxID=2986829 RepID=UPI0029CABC62|nr:hypothetical protein [Flavobacterium sp. N2038]